VPIIIDIFSSLCVRAELNNYLRYYGVHLEFPLPLWCGNVGSGATEFPDPKKVVLGFEIALLAPPQAEI